MKIKKAVQFALLLILCLAVSGCRTRTGISGQTGADESENPAGKSALSLSGILPADETGDSGAEQEKNEASGEQTKENPEASRKEYDESRPAEIIPGKERTVHGAGEGGGSAASGEDTERMAAKLSEEAEKPATQTVPADEAEQLFAKTERDAKARLQSYKDKAEK